MMSWNATGIMTSIPYLLNELKNKAISICGISEHWLTQHNAYILETVNNDYDAHVITCSNPKSLNARLYGKGGVAILWRKAFSNLIETIETYSDRIAAVKLSCNDLNIYILQVYLPCTNEPIDYYKSEVDKLSDILSMINNTDHVVLMGDFNCKILSKAMQTGAGTRDKYVCKLIESNNLKIITGTDRCKGPSYSFHPGATNIPTLIDHFIINESLVPTLTNCFIDDDSPLNISRHLPLFAQLNINTNTIQKNINADIFTKQCYNWSSELQKQRYCSEVTNFVQRTICDFEDINSTYENLVLGLQSASAKCIKKRSFKRYLKPYWSPVIEELHKSMSQSRNLWILNGRLRNDIHYHNYKEEKRKFRHRMRLAANEFEISEYERIDQLAEIDQKGFWKIIKSKRKSKQSVNHSNEIYFNDKLEKDPDSILNGWCDYFRKLYTFSNEDNFDDEFRGKVEKDIQCYLKVDENSQSTNYLTNEVTDEELNSIISSLPNGKCASSDNLTYEHVKYGGLALIGYIRKLFNAIIRNVKVPNAFKEGITVTLHKGNGKTKTDPNNYRAYRFSQ